MSKHDNLEQNSSINKLSSKEKSTKSAKAIAAILTFALFTSGCSNGDAEALKNEALNGSKAATTNEISQSETSQGSSSNSQSSSESLESAVLEAIQATNKPNETTSNTPEANTQTTENSEAEKEPITMMPLGTEAELNIDTEFSNGEKVDYSEAPTNLVESYNFKYLTAEQQASLKEYEAMELTDFRKLSNEEQLVYASWVLKNNQPRFEKALAAYGIDKKYSYLVNTHGDLIENFEYINIFIANLYIQDPDGKNGELKYDKETAYKLLPLLQYAVGDGNEFTRGYDKSVDFFSKLDSISMCDFQVNILKSMNTKTIVADKGYPGMIANLELIGSERITYSEPKKQGVFLLFPTTTITGEKTEITQTIGFEDMEHALEINE